MATIAQANIGGQVTEQELAELRERLVSDPFDEEARLSYAQYLVDNGDSSEARRQYQLVLKSNAASPSALVGVALCALRTDDKALALSEYRRARNLPGFQPNAELDSAESTAQAQTPALSLVPKTETPVVRIRDEYSEKVVFADIAGMEKLKKLLRLQIVEPFRNPGLFQKFRKKSGGGVLLYGPPGCGKTFMARAIAGECNAEFQTVGISDVLNMWVGESERNLASIFEKARAQAPCVLFFDELDALAYSRSKSSSSASRTVVNEFLAQLDGFTANNQELLVLAATNMPWDVDPAMKRPGRFSRQVFVPPPDEAARLEMLKTKTVGVPTMDFGFGSIASQTKLFSGADIDGLIERAKESALSDILASGSERPLSAADFTEALDEMNPSTVEWLKTARNLVRFSGADNSYKEVAKFLKSVNF